MKTRNDSGDFPILMFPKTSAEPLFLTHQDFTLIVVVAHSSRKPGYWVERIPSEFVPGTSSE